jgi:hypothetical protein
MAKSLTALRIGTKDRPAGKRGGLAELKKEAKIMSTLIAVNVDGVVVLATDSRATHLSGGFTDTSEKLFEIAPNVFYTNTGWVELGEKQMRIAAGLLRTADLGNPEDFADQLDQASRPAMERLVAGIMQFRSVAPIVEEKAAGVLPFHTYVLAFVSGGRPGFIARSFTLQNGQVVCSKLCCFELPAGSRAQFITGGRLIEGLRDDPMIWLQGPIRGVERILDGLRSATEYVGGPTQLVCINRAGSLWIRRPWNRAQDAASINSGGVDLPAVPVAQASAWQTVEIPKVCGALPKAIGLGSRVLTSLGPSFNVVSQQLASLSASGLGPGTAIAGAYTFMYSATGPAVEIGAPGAIFVDNYTSPVNTVTINSSGINVTGGATSGVTIQDATAANKVQISNSGITITGAGGIMIQNASDNSRLQILSEQINFYGGNVLCMEIAASGLQLYTPAGLAVVTINSSGLTIGSGATITSPSISGGSLSGCSLTVVGPNSKATLTPSADGLDISGLSGGPYAGYTAIYGQAFASISNGSAFSSMAPTGFTANGLAGGNFTFKDQAGVTHTVVGGILVS